MHSPAFVFFGLASLCRRLKDPITKCLRELCLAFAAAGVLLHSVGSGLIGLLPPAAVVVLKWLWNRDDLFVLIALVHFYSVGAIFNAGSLFMMWVAVTISAAVANSARRIAGEHGVVWALQLGAALPVCMMGITMLVIKRTDKTQPLVA
jgi:hypothetical protein